MDDVLVVEIVQGGGDRCTDRGYFIEGQR